MRTQGEPLLVDHVDMRMVAGDDGRPATDRNSIVQLDPDHPGFRDAEYRERRNFIARLAMNYKPGTTIPDAPYTADEHRVWGLIWDAVEDAHREHACEQYLSALGRLELPRTRIPQMREISKRVEAISGFRLEPVAGLVEARVFLESLADGVFLSTQYIRHHSTPLYTPEPDVAHEIIGHAVTLANRELAELNRLFGEAVKRTPRGEAMERLSRVYWFTVEFGVVRQGGRLKAYGTGLLSSAGELKAMHEAELLPLDLEAASRREYNPTHYQPALFCADSFDAMYLTVKDYLMRWR